MVTSPPQTITWLQQHERLIIVLLVLLAGAWGANRWFDYAALQDQQKTQQAQAALTQQKAANDALVKQIANTTAQYQAQFTALAQQTQQLQVSMATRQTQLKQQQTVDQKATPKELLNRWAQLVGPNIADLPNAVTYEQNVGIVVSQEAASATVASMEQIPVLQQNVHDLMTQNEAYQSAASTSQTLIAEDAKEITGLNAQLVDANKLCQDQISTIKAQARKSKMKWFGLGVVAGFIGKAFI